MIKSALSNKMVIRSILFILGNLFFSCESSFNKDYYERISDMKFPEQIRVIETFDNGEFFTTTSFEVDSLSLIKFMNKYKFEQHDGPYPLLFFGEKILKETKPDFNNLNSLYFSIGTKGKNSWIYIIDLKHKILWAEIQYPDWAGT